MRIPFFAVTMMFSCVIGWAQGTTWPKSFVSAEGATITIFQPQAESLDGNLLKTRAACSVLEAGKTDPYYGAVWGDARLLTNRDNRTYALESLKITRIRLPEGVDEGKIANLQSDIERVALGWNVSGSLENLLLAVEQSQNEQKQSEQLNTTPPKIIYTDNPSMLVLIDGEPKGLEDKELGVKRVVNTPSLMVTPAGGQYYLYGGGFWYEASRATGPYSHVTKIPKSLTKVQKKIDEIEKEDKGVDKPKTTAPVAVVVSTTPAELIVTKGKPEMATIEGVNNLLYVSNTENELFMDVTTQQYYVLLSGRWYRSESVQEGPWSYVASDKLPADFAKIPEGSAKDGVLANVAGTPSALDALLDAQIPQTAKVDRKSANASVTYDGDPKFVNIENTSLQYAENTSSSVLRDGNNYYTVENGVWFVSRNPNGPWSVATTRPQGIQNIPPNSPAYNTKFVYIYDVTPDFVYMGYTPGYLGTYVYGPTIVYGTGFNYRPWFGNWYYPRPCTWGFNMFYNPWTGWSFGFSYGWGWYRPWYWGNWYGGGWGGWWGPPAYRPPYWGYHNRPHYGPRGPGVNINNVNINHSNNLYNYRKDVITKDRRPAQPSARPTQPGRQPAQPENRPAPRPQEPTTRPVPRPQEPTTRPAPRPQQPTTRPAPVFTDKEGNVYQKDPSSNRWETHQQNQWRPAPNNSSQQMDRQRSQIDRSNMREQNFNRANQGANMGRNYTRPGAPSNIPRSRN
jgi:hypothetical protein